MNPAASLLLDCLHRDPARVSPDRLRTLSPVEATAFVSTAEEHKLAPLLAARLRAHGLDSELPEEARKMLTGAYRRNALRNLGHQGAFRTIGLAFEKANIPLIALKGIYLAEAVYANPAERQMGDIDILVPEADVWRASDALQEAGFPAIEPFTRGAPLSASLVLPPFIRPGLAKVELHWSIVEFPGDFRMGVEEYWQRSIPANVGGRPVRVFDHEDQLLHLCVHGAYQHRFWFGLGPLCDIAAVSTAFADSIDWTAFERRTRARRFDRGVYLILRLAQEWLGAPIPDATVAALRPPDFDESLAEAARESMVAQIDERQTGDRMTAELSRSRMDNPLSRAGAILSRLFRRPEEVALRHGLPADSKLAYLYYPKDWWWMASRWRQAADLLAGDETFTTIASRNAAMRAWLQGQ